MNFRYLQKKDYNLNYLDLLEQLTKVDKGQISQNDFSNFIDTLIENRENHQIIVIEINNKIVATGTILIENKLIHGINKVAHLEDIVVDNTMRGKGIGKKLISFLLDIAENKKCYKTILNCKKEYITFYEKCGLKHSGAEMVKYIK